MTAINYVRHLAGSGVVAAHGHRSQAPLHPCPPLPPVPSTVVPGVPMCGSVRRREARLWLSLFNNVARNSPLTHSKFEFASLELQRF